MDGVRAGVASVMCSYNRINNTYGCENSKLMNGVLKSELAFDGFVMLDWNAQHNLQSANGGLDMVMPYGGSWGDNLTHAVRNGTVTEKRITDMATRSDDEKKTLVPLLVILTTDRLCRILAAWYLVGQDAPDFPAPGVGMKNLSLPHEPVDARVPESKPVLLGGAVAGHVLVKNVNRTLPFRSKPKMLSVYGYDAAPPPTKNIDTLFQLGYTSSQEMGQAVLGTLRSFDQAARGGTITTGGRAGANAPPYMSDPLSAIQHRAAADGTWVNWDIASTTPDVNGATQACLVFINAIATEGWDRTGLHDDASDGLVLHVASRCANTVVVVHAAGIRLVDQWIEHPNVTAAVLAHLPGQDSGTALVRLLYGEDNFSGRLPYTVARNESDYPVYAPCGRGRDNTTDPQCDYTEGVYLDYRAFDARNVTPRFEFGYGLSYTTFEYSSLALSPTRALCATPPSSPSSSSTNSTHDGLWDVVAHVEATVANAGPVSGDEVAQLYVGIPGAPPKQLRGFEKVHLRPGAAATVRFDLTRRDVSVWDVARQRWVVQKGEYPVYVGASCRDVRLTGSLVVE
ncbi:Beta-glucosidase [Purpureocillium takamizusanense]|nr:Beta-glucosidase [Purpureocillium takamizusanense]UNI19126.1 Beta-glucosidase [Purpureocillium takamizusanense]